MCHDRHLLPLQHQPAQVGVKMPSDEVFATRRVAVTPESVVDCHPVTNLPNDLHHRHLQHRPALPSAGLASRPMDAVSQSVTPTCVAMTQTAMYRCARPPAVLASSQMDSANLSAIFLSAIMIPTVISLLTTHLHHHRDQLGRPLDQLPGDLPGHPPGHLPGHPPGHQPGQLEGLRPRLLPVHRYVAADSRQMVGARCSVTHQPVASTQTVKKHPTSQRTYTCRRQGTPVHPIVLAVVVGHLPYRAWLHLYPATARRLYQPRPAIAELQLHLPTNLGQEDTQHKPVRYRRSGLDDKMQQATAEVRRQRVATTGICFSVLA